MYWYCIGMGILHTGPPNIPIKPGVKYTGSLPYITMNSGFGYAMGEIPAGVQLDYFCRVGKEPVEAQYMHGVQLCNESTFTIVSDRKKSCTRLRTPCTTVESSTRALLYSVMMKSALL